MNAKTALAAFMVFSLLLTPSLWAGAPQEPSQQPAPETQQEFEIVVSEGTVIPVVLTAYLNSQSSQPGDIFYADTTYPIWIQQRLVIPKGSTVRGTVTEVVRPGKIKGKGRLSVRFVDILLPNGVRRDFVGTFKGLHGPGDESLDRKTESVSAGASKGQDAGTVIGTTSTGALIGAAASGGGGAAIGAGAGAAVGAAAVLFSRGRDVVISPGTQFDLELLKPLKFAYNEIEFSSAQLNSAQRQYQLRPANQPRRRGVRFPGIFSPWPF